MTGGDFPFALPWQGLRIRREAWRGRHLRDLFAQAPDRFARFSLRCGDILLDYSKTHIEKPDLDALLSLAIAADLPHWRDRLFAGDPINESEARAVLHWALRDLSPSAVFCEGVDLKPMIRAERDRLLAFAEAVREARILGAAGRPIRRIVNIGIGGSDLGPAMAVEAMRPYRDRDLEFRFAANIDPAALSAALAGADPGATFFLVSSKTFTTEETLANALAARGWLAAQSLDPASAMLAITAAPEKAIAFGIKADRVFRFWDWVGGRYSIWSAIGLPLAIAIGRDRFCRFLEGGSAIDRHFRSAPLSANMPVLMALIGLWYRNFWSMPALAILPYAQDLARFPAYLQQLDMESNGKSVRRDGGPAPQTAPIVWGEPGTNGQHAFHQWLHQGTTPILCDFILAARPAAGEDRDRHHALFAHGLAQSQALAFGRDAEATAARLAAEPQDPDRLRRLLPGRHFPGDRPSLSLVFPELDPYHLGALIALYEHKVFVQGILWNINSFDQWGVELGKILAPGIKAGEAADSSTAGLLAYYDEKAQG